VKAVQSRPLSPPVAQSALPAPVAPKTLAAVAPGTANSHGGWTAEGGSSIIVAQGDSAEALARRYGIPVEALMRTNGFATSAEVQPGTRLIIPVYSAALAAANAGKPVLPRGAEQSRNLAASTKSVPATKTVASVVPTPPATPIGAPSRPFASPAPAPAKMAEAPAVSKQPAIAASAARKQDQVKEPAKKFAAVTKPEPVQTEVVKPAPAAKAEPARITKAEPSVAEPKKTAAQGGQGAQEPTAIQETAKTNIASEVANPEFRWPARGRIIQGFKRGGNDGINIAVPEGTSVKAAENGIVAYAGELKGYGNLVMIRHPNGFVSAYANNGDIEVKRGDNVKRGQTIAKSGQSGDVSSPQLHFELRKGATPVDPTQYLAGL
jgi:murein DD-endopeptidase MepM/ murein hydrolase activator NlpD